MEKTEEIEKINALTLKALEAYPETRDSDMRLFVMVSRMKNPISSRMPLENALWHAKEYGLPNYETVSRARRYIQNERPDLKACAEVENERKTNEEAFREFYSEK